MYEILSSRLRKCGVKLWGIEEIIARWDMERVG